MTRRIFLSGAALAAGTRFHLRAASAPLHPAKEMAVILTRIKPPKFANRSFDITRYGAKQGGKEIATDAIRTAISACSSAGGGRVVVPKGTFLTGAIHLKSNVNLHLEDGATLLFSRDPKDFLPVVFTRFEGTECMNYSPFIYAWEQTNIAVTGNGMLDGQADKDHWWNMRSGAKRAELVSMGDKDVPVKDRIFGEGGGLRPNFFQPYRCTNVMIEGVSIRNSPMWELNPVLCKNVTVRNVKISSHGPNNDGCDPESSTDVLIEGCEFDTGDDCIAIKSGRNRDGRRVNAACENIIVRNCRMKDGHGGVSIGSEVSGGVRNVFMENNQMDSPHLDRALRIKTNSWRGGVLENFYFRNNTVGEVAQGVIDIDFYYSEAPRDPTGGGFTPVMNNVVVENITSEKSKYALYLRGYPEAPIKDVHVSHCTFNNVTETDVIQNVADIKLEDCKRNGEAMKQA
ncbi:MAG TPA: glycoside hydrolase family 28 protein [Bryobacteraceae bacterium]|nr:glycoside hydrolase family 28 protein [Bryobacteraceae bacterium]